MSYPNHPQQSGDYGQPYAGAPAQQKNGLAVAALVCGILAVFASITIIGGFLLGLLGLIFGIIAALKARGGRAPHRVMAIIGAVLGGVGLILSGVFIAIGASFLNSDEFKSFSDCVQHAKTQSEQDECSKQFNKDMGN
ncbi:DUF4190 domain-containing protein [Streptomyces sp. NPDC087440]|uniref:DUF4190 domain-containing protein n=1 Tax=Streptomyces sp. NPDC087440 TaxID=3365790 RepID=UPI0037FBFDCA